MKRITYIIICLWLTQISFGQTISSLGNSGGAFTWSKLGRLTLSQQGHDALIRIMGGYGYNASVNQNAEAIIHFRTSNANSENNGFYASGSFYNTGRSKIINGLRVVQIDLATWDFYAYLPSYTGDGATLIVESADGSWIKDFYIVSTPPNSGVYKDLPEELVFQSQVYFNQNVGTTSPIDRVQVAPLNSHWTGLTIGTNYYAPALSFMRDFNDATYSGGIDWSSIVTKDNQGTQLAAITVDRNGTSAGLKGSMHFLTGGGNETMYLKSDGNVGIGTTFPSEKLSVNGNIRSKKLIVTQTGWSDYVFNDNYRLQPLSQLEQYIKIHKHLPDMPSAKEVAGNGIDVGDNQALLLKKIEELTLYMIEMKKENEKTRKENNEMNKKIAIQQNEIETLKKRFRNKKI